MTDKLMTRDGFAGLDLQSFAGLLSSSGYFQDAKDVGQAAVKVLAGRELGIPPVAAMTGINIIKGKVTLSANLIAAVIKKSGRYTYRVKSFTDTACVLTFFEGSQEVGESTFSLDDAKRAGLTGDNWKKFPRNMLFARALTNGAKWFCPDIFAGGIYTPEELDDAPPALAEVADPVDRFSPEVVDQFCAAVEALESATGKDLRDWRAGVLSGECHTSEGWETVTSDADLQRVTKRLRRQIATKNEVQEEVVEDAEDTGDSDVDVPFA